MGETPPLPEHPELRVLAQALEAIGAAAEILDHKRRVVFTSTEDALCLGLVPAVVRQQYGLSLAVRIQPAADATIERLDATDAQVLAVDPNGLTYRTMAELTTNEKAIRDAGSIPVAQL